MAYDNIPRFDPETGAPLVQKSALKRSENLETEKTAVESNPPQAQLKKSQFRTEYEEQHQQRFDPNTGKPIFTQNCSKQNAEYVSASVDQKPIPRFDPETGAPLYAQTYASPINHTQNAFGDTYQKKQTSGSKNRTFIILMIVLLSIILTGIGVILYFVLTGCGKDTEKEKPEPTAVSETTQTPLPQNTPFLSPEPEPTPVPQQEPEPTPVPQQEPESETQPEEQEPVTETPPEEQEPITGAPPEEPAPAEYPFPTGGIPESLVSQYAGGFISDSRNSYTCSGITHQIDSYSKTDTVGLSLEEDRSNDTYRSYLTMTFRFNTASNAWELISYYQTVPEAVSYLSLSDSFQFGGATIKRNETDINGKTLNINGTRETFKTITRDEVEMLSVMCPDLVTLQLEYCYLDTYEPLSKLTSLEVLDLKNCGNTYGLGKQITDISWIAPLTNLRELRLDGNAIYDVTPLEGMQELTLINLSNNKIGNTAMESLAKLEKLEYVNLYNNEISDFSPLTALENIIYLNIHETNLESIAFLKKMPSLSWIYVGLDYEGNPLPQFDWYHIIKNYTNIKKVNVREKDTYVLQQMQWLKDDNVINELKKY